MLPQLGTFWTVPNALSLSRVVLAVPTAALIALDADPWLLVSLLVLIGATDWLDGQVARRHAAGSEWGKVLDPLADKIAFLLIGLAIVFKGLLPLWLVSLIVLRDILIIAGAATVVRGMGKVMGSMWLGKAATTAMALAILAAVLHADGLVMAVCIWGTAALTVLSFAQYARRFLNLRTASNV